MKTRVGEFINNKAKQVFAPTGKAVTIVNDADMARIAKQCELSIREVSIAAMEQGVRPCRYLRNGEVINLEDQLQLAKSKVGIIGAGGLGGQVILLLARLGIGEMIVIDSDVFDETNLNRQALSSIEVFDLPKAKTAKQVVKGINPAVEVCPHIAMVSESNAAALLQDSDIIVDALDNIPDRLTLEKAALDLNVPMIHGAIAGFDGQFTVVMPGQTQLRKIMGERVPAQADYISSEKVLGVPAVTASIIAGFQVMEVLKILLNRGAPSAGTLSHLSLESLQFNQFKF